MLEKQDEAKDESVEAVFMSILRQKDLDIRDKRAAIVDFIAAGIHTVRESVDFFFSFGFTVRGQNRSETSNVKLSKEMAMSAHAWLDFALLLFQPPGIKSRLKTS